MTNGDDRGVTLHHGDCLDVLPTLEAATFDACVTDPPYGLKFMGRAWDHGVPGVPFWEAVYRVLKPGAVLMAFGGSRTHHRLACAIEDAGFPIEDSIHWIYGCLSEDSEILTEGGWEQCHEAIVGKRVVAYNVDTDLLEWQAIQDVYVYDYGDTAYRIRSGHTDQIVSRNHRCLVERGGKYTFRRAEEAAREREARVPILEDVRGLLRTLPLPEQHPGGSQQGPQVARASRFARADPAAITPIPYVGVVWCVRVPSGAFVARRNGQAFITGNSGFPKHKSKLKPAHEPVVLARKPGPKWLGVDAGRIPAPGGLTPGGDNRGSSPCPMSRAALKAEDRPRSEEHPDGRYPPNLVYCHHPDCRPCGTRKVKPARHGGGKSSTVVRKSVVSWRFQDHDRDASDYTGPDGMEEVAAYECVEGCPVAALDRQGGVSRSAGGVNAGTLGKRIYGKFSGKRCSSTAGGFGDTGTASRFFPCFAWQADDFAPFLYCPKAGRRERNAGLEKSGVKMREDLTPEQRSFVLAELRSVGVSL